MSLEHYEVAGELARGGMGVVYRARDPRLGREVVIKVVSGQLDGEARARFDREARAVGRLRHPCVVAVHETGVDPQGRPYLVMELVPGGSLKERLERVGPFDVDEAARIVERLADGVEHAHAHGVLHRDLKPENVLLPEFGAEPVLTDFGLALMTGRDTRLTLSGEAMGTPVYMPPEQANGELDRIGPASDVYGLGAILYALLTGRAPFVGSHLIAILNAVLTSDPEAPSALRPEVDAGLEGIVRRCLEKDPDKRYPSAAALRDALQAWRQNEQPADRAGWAVPALGLAAVALLVVLVVLAVRLPEEPAVAATPSALPAPVTPTPTPAVPDSSPTTAPTPVPSHTVVIQPGPLEGKDATVRQDGWYGNDNRGAHRQLIVGRRIQRDSRNRVYRSELRSYLQFDLARYLPKEARITSARLELHALDVPHFHAPGMAIPMVVRPVLERPWEEGTSGIDEYADGILYGSHPRERRSHARVHDDRNLQPGVGSVVARAVAPKERGRWTRIDLTALARKWHRRELPNYGFRIEPSSTFNGSCGRAFVSSDHRRAKLWPKLIVEYAGSSPRVPDVEGERAAARRAALREIRARARVRPPEQVRRATAAIRRAPFLWRAFQERAQALLRVRPQTDVTLSSAHGDYQRALVALEPPPDPIPHILVMAEAALLGREASRLTDVLYFVDRELGLRPGHRALKAVKERLETEYKLRTKPR